MSFLKRFTWYIIITPAQAKHCVIPFVRGRHLLSSQLAGEQTDHKAATRWVNLFGMHIISLVAITASTHFTYPQRDGGLGQPPASLSLGIEPGTCHMKICCTTQVLNPGPLTRRPAALPTELSRCSIFKCGTWWSAVHCTIGYPKMWVSALHHRLWPFFTADPHPRVHAHRPTVVHGSHNCVGLQGIPLNLSLNSPLSCNFPT